MHFHTVLFQFSPETSEDVIDNALERLRAMHAIPAVRSIAVGTNMMPVRDGWTHGMTIAFDSFTSMMEEFAEHPLHVGVTRDVVPTFSQYMAMDVATADA